MINIRNLLTGEITRLAAVVRFNNAHRNRDESVAEHIGFVSIYSMMLGHWYESRVGNDVDWRDLMTRVTIHDAEEGLSGDFPRSFKYSSVAVKRALDVAASKAAVTVFADMCDHDECSVAYLHERWEYAKGDSVEGTILQIADCLSTISYVYREWKTGNKLILENCSDLEANWHEMVNTKSVIPFWPLIRSDVHNLLAEMWNDS